MSSKNVCICLQKPVSCFDCQCKILSDPVLDVLEAVDWSRFRFLERYKGRGRRNKYSRVGILKALFYMELARLDSVHELIRVLERYPYKMNILGLNGVPSDSVFSRFKQDLGEALDRIMSILVGMLRKLDRKLFKALGIDSTKIEAYSRKDRGAGWGWDHMAGKYYKGYKAHILYDIRSLTPVSYMVTSASVHDNTQIKPLLKKLGAGLLPLIGLLGDKAYDSKDNVESLVKVGTTMLNPRNKRNSKKPQKKYRLQDYCEAHGNKLNKIYRNRYDCEVTNKLLKEHLGLKSPRTIGRKRTRIKIGLTLTARQIQVLYQLKTGKTPRTTITNQL
jgi:IS5 family transposase